MSRGRRAALQSGWLIALFCTFLQSKAQQQVTFSNIGFEQAMASARKTNKVIFVDVRGMGSSAYNDQVEKEVFTIDSIARYFNQHVISIHMPMNTAEGKKFAPRLAMLMYPAYVFYDGEGNQLEFTNAAVVAKDAKVLMEKARTSVTSAAIRQANKKRIQFDSSRWQQVLQRAKQENKLVFVDAYTEWCRPCIMMAKNVFTLDTIADYFNAHFINVTMDMEKGEGPALGKKYKVAAYPTFLFIDGDGKLVYTDGGYKEAPEFIKVGEAASQAKAVADKAAGIQFKDTSWSAMLAEAKQTGKLIFMDAHTTWCGPCKWMSSHVFNTAEAGNIYNRNFINAYTDMEKGEGIELRKQYAVKAYPTYLFINGDGEVVHRVVGSCATAEFVQHGLDALSPQRNLLYLQQHYKENAGKYEYVQTYLQALQRSYDATAANKIALAYLHSQDSATWSQPAQWQLFKAYVTDVTTPVFQYVIGHQAAFTASYGQEAADKLYSSFLAWPQQYVTYPDKGKAVLDEKGFEAFLAQVAAGNYSRKEEVIARARLTIHFNTRNWDGYVGTVENMLTRQLLSYTSREHAEQLYGYADIVRRFGNTNKKAVTIATGWAEHITATPGISAANKATYQELYAQLLDASGQPELAKEVRRNIDQQKLTEAQDGMPMKQMRIIPKQPS